MEPYKIQLVAIVTLMLVFPNTQGWGIDGHAIVCKIAQSRLSNSAAEAVKNLLPEYVENDLARLCSWADDVKYEAGRSWSAALHFVNTPDFLCNYQYDRDCKNRQEQKGRCVVGAINNYTNQLLNYGRDTTYDLTEALLFLSHFIGDIHQPLHCGFVSDQGGNTIRVTWFTERRTLHFVWDDDIIETAKERFYNSDRGEFINAIQQNITKAWADQVKGWENCGPYEIPCPDIYASESIEAACQWAYKDVTENSALADDYFLSRLPIVNLRLAQAAVRLAASLNRIFDRQYAVAI